MLAAASYKLVSQLFQTFHCHKMNKSHPSYKLNCWAPLLWSRTLQPIRESFRDSPDSRSGVSTVKWNVLNPVSNSCHRKSALKCWVLFETIGKIIENPWRNAGFSLGNPSHLRDSQWQSRLEVAGVAHQWQDMLHAHLRQVCQLPGTRDMGHGHRWVTRFTWCEPWSTY